MSSIDSCHAKERPGMTGSDGNVIANGTDKGVPA